MNTYKYMHMFAYICTYTRVDIHACMHACMHACTHKHIHAKSIYIHTRTYSHLQRTT